MDIKNRCIDIAKTALHTYDWPEMAYIALNAAYNDDFLFIICEYLANKENDYLIDNVADFPFYCWTTDIKFDDIRYFIWILLHPGESIRKDNNESYRTYH